MISQRKRQTGGNKYQNLSLCRSSCHISNYKLSEEWTQSDQDSAGADRSCIAGGQISFSVSQMISRLGALSPPSVVKRPQPYPSPWQRRKLKTVGDLTQHAGHANDFSSGFFSTGCKWAAAVPCLTRCEKLQPDLAAPAGKTLGGYAPCFVCLMSTIEFYLLSDHYVKTMTENAKYWGKFPVKTTVGWLDDSREIGENVIFFSTLNK